MTYHRIFYQSNMTLDGTTGYRHRILLLCCGVQHIRRRCQLGVGDNSNNRLKDMTRMQTCLPCIWRMTLLVRTCLWVVTVNLLQGTIYDFLSNSIISPFYLWQSRYPNVTFYLPDLLFSSISTNYRSTLASRTLYQWLHMTIDWKVKTIYMFHK